MRGPNALHVVILLSSVGAFALSACSGASTGSGFGDPDGGGSGGGSSGGGGSGGGGSGGGSDASFIGDGGFGGGGADAAPPGKTLLYAHDNTSLYSIDPTSTTLASTLIGKFDCIGNGGPTSMTDLGVDKSGNLFGVATDTIFLNMKISGGSVQCAQGAVPITGMSGVKFYGMSFAPVGTLDPNSETLVVGNTNGELYQVNTSSGALSLVGTFGNVPAQDPSGNSYNNAGQPWEMSGDIVFLENNGKPIGFATLRDCPNPPSSSGCNPTDTLAQIDLVKMKANPNDPAAVVVRGQILKAPSCQDTNTGYGSMYGIAAFQDKVIGFSHDGFTVSIDNNLGTACLIAAVSQKWAGAGVTTTVPVVAPPMVK